jgi:hypothetical protein
MVTISLIKFRDTMPSATERFSQLLAVGIAYHFTLGLVLFYTG